ncbi:DUF134 domain-containing protein [Candidatus Woesearchaeota archaeon]|nr:DUF134 domain-containing protein [Candidatus Woesearchaeota archaeon]
MPRPRRFRRVGFMPDVTFFKPSGIRKSELSEIVLTVDEFEAVRLKDFLGIEQTDAAKKMKISQPTFNRILRCARKKIADAIVNGKSIKIEGGKYKMVQPRGRGRGQGRGMGSGAGRGMGFGGPAEFCICPKCRTKVQKQRARPCTEMSCPECGALMMRG